MYFCFYHKQDLCLALLNISTNGDPGPGKNEMSLHTGIMLLLTSDVYCLINHILYTNMRHCLLKTLLLKH